ncbi:hypothetical protein [Enterococcus casseliflavus]|uniref:hypothetical protein n=1 Tax=Enterococcus casseliflavus TaxID=37734 RepID=UPI003D10A8BB
MNGFELNCLKCGKRILLNNEDIKNKKDIKLEVTQTFGECWKDVEIVITCMHCGNNIFDGNI